MPLDCWICVTRPYIPANNRPFSVCTPGTGWCGCASYPSWASAAAGWWIARPGRWWPARSSVCWRSNGTCPAPRYTRWTAWPGSPPDTIRDWPATGRLPPRLPPCAVTALTVRDLVLTARYTKVRMGRRGEGFVFVREPFVRQ